MDRQVGPQNTVPILDGTTGPHRLLPSPEQEVCVRPPVGWQVRQQGLSAWSQDDPPLPRPAQQMDCALAQRLSCGLLQGIESRSKEHQLRQAAMQFQQHYNWSRPHQGLSCGNRPPRVAFPTLPELPPVPDVVDADRWLRVNDGLHLVRLVRRDGTVRVDLKSYYVALHLSAAKRALLVVHDHQVTKMLPLKGLWGKALRFEVFVRLMMGQVMLSIAYALPKNAALVWADMPPLRGTMLGNSGGHEVGNLYIWFRGIAGKAHTATIHWKHLGAARLSSSSKDSTVSSSPCRLALDKTPCAGWAASTTTSSSRCNSADRYLRLSATYWT